VTQSFLQLERVTKRYGGHGGIADVSLAVSAGERVVVVGPSGSGKTTLLRLIAGLERPEAGEIWLDGRKVAEAGRNLVPANERRVGFVFQDLALWPHLRADENVKFAADSLGITKAERTTRITSTLELCRLDQQLARRYPHELSGGEQQRVALARALVGAPPLLLFDEPFTGLDADLRATLRNELVALQHRLRFTTIYVTHDPHDAETLGDRTITIRHARIEPAESLKR